MLFPNWKSAMERLDAWIRRKAATARDEKARRGFRKSFATRIGVSLGALSRYCQPPTAKHFRMPTQEVMLRIYIATSGEVDPNSFYDLPEIQRDIEDAIHKARAA
jgi:hypothetical protein